METTSASGVDSVVYACSHCGGKNRILRGRVADDPQCGRCHERIFPRAPVAVTDDTWRAEVEEAPLPVLVDFWAPWCGPCRAVAPMLQQLAAERAGRLKIVKVNVDENPRLAARFQIQSIPTLMLRRGPILLDEIRGALPKPALEARLARFL